MKILSITAGAAGMYCGSCLRDNALAAELMAQGHDVLLLPVYTPTLTDEENVSSGRVFFGGISVYLQQNSALFRKTPRLLDRLWDSRLALKLASRRSIPTNPEFLGEMTLSMLKGSEGFLRKEFQKLESWLAAEPPPDVTILPNSLVIAMAEPVARATKRPVVCTLQGEDLYLDGLMEPYRTRALAAIRARVNHVDAFLATSDYYASYMSQYLAIPREKIYTVPLGIRFDGYTSIRRSASKTFNIGYFARVAPEKSLHLLCEAYRLLRQRGDMPPCALEVAGYLAPEHRDYLAGLERRMREWGFGEQFHYRGVLDREQKIRFLQNLDVLSVPSEYADPKGMYLLEAMAVGLPVVQPCHGAFPEIVQRTGGGLLFEPGSIQRLADQIYRIATDTSLALTLGRQAYDGVREHYSVSRMAACALEVFRSVAAKRLPAGQPV